MPELPEVEMVARELQRRIAGRTIVQADLRREKLAPDVPPAAFAEQLAGACVLSVHRRGKHILIDLQNGRTLIVHLRMSGRFFLLSPDEVDPKFSHAVFYLDEGGRLVFDDQRHFGMMKIVDTGKIAETREIAKLAPEPFSDDFSAVYLTERVWSSARILKEILLDQTKVCGVGNIYASEALFLSGIDPRKRGKRVSIVRCGGLHENIRAVLAEAIDSAESLQAHPTIIGEAVYGNGSDTRWRVYDRENQPCLVCGTSIRRITQGSRSTYFCPKCQK